MVNYSAPVSLTFFGRGHTKEVSANHTLTTALKAVNRLPGRQRANAIIHFDESAGLSLPSPLRVREIEQLCKPVGSPMTGRCQRGPKARNGSQE